MKRKEMRSEIKRLRSERKGNIFPVFGEALKGSGKVLKNTGKAVGKGLLRMGQAQHEFYYGKKDKKKTKRLI